MKVFYFTIPLNGRVPLAPEDQPSDIIIEVSGMAAVAIGEDEIEAREALISWAQDEGLDHRWLKVAKVRVFNTDKAKKIAWVEI